MKKSYIFFAVCVSFVSAGASTLTPTPTPRTPWTTPTTTPAPTEWDVYVFSQFWPTGTCVDLKKQNLTCHLPRNGRGWTIHGLWPTLYGTEGPNFCGNISLDFEKIKSIQEKLKASWPSLDNGTTDEQFWQHEWSKHGTCVSDSTDGQLSFFDQALEWSDDYNMELILKEANFIPVSTPYDKIYLNNELSKIIGKKPSLSCYDTQDNSILTEVRLCFGRYNLTLVDCSPSTSCNGSKILFDDGSRDSSGGSFIEPSFALISILLAFLGN